MYAYKAVREAGNGWFTSVVTTGEAAIAYHVGVKAISLPALANNGYHPTVFRTLQQAIAGQSKLTNDFTGLKIFRVRTSKLLEPPEIISPCNLTYLLHPERLREDDRGFVSRMNKSWDDTGWPTGTAMARTVTLLHQVYPVEEGSKRP